MLKYCQCPVDIHDYHQLVVQISCTYLGLENVMNDEEEHNVFAHSMVILFKQPTAFMHQNLVISLLSPVRPCSALFLNWKIGGVSQNSYLENLQSFLQLLLRFLYECRQTPFSYAKQTCHSFHWDINIYHFWSRASKRDCEGPLALQTNGRDICQTSSLYEQWKIAQLPLNHICYFSSAELSFS